jgi:hypothetical protein
MPDLTIRAHANDLRPGMGVDIMPQATTATQPIAEGIVIQLNGATRQGISLSKNRFLIKVTKVLDPKALIHFPCTETGVRCKCLRSEHGKLREMCDLRSFEDFPTVPPFTIVETVGRLRLRHEVPVEESVGELPGARRVDDDESMGMEVDATLADEGQLDEEQEDNDSCRSEDEEPVLDDTESVASDSEENFEKLETLKLTKEYLDELDAMADRMEDPNNDAEQDEGFVGATLLISGDDDDDEIPTGVENGDAEENAATPEQVANVDALDETIQKILKDADEFAKAKMDTTTGNDGTSGLPAPNNEQEQDIGSGTGAPDIDDLTEEEASILELISRILGDAFHAMDRVKVPMHHELKAAYFRALRGAFFIMDAGDARRVKHVLQQKGRSWSHMTAFNFAYIALRVKRYIPSPMVLYYRVKAVFDFFMDKKDTLTGKPLFHAEAKKAAQRDLAAIRRGEFSDPPGVDFYVRKTDKSGREMVDSDGLWLYRSIRGTSNLESLHQKLTEAFGHKRAGPQYSYIDISSD